MLQKIVETPQFIKSIEELHKGYIFFKISKDLADFFVFLILFHELIVTQVFDGEWNAEHISSRPITRKYFSSPNG